MHDRTPLAFEIRSRAGWLRSEIARLEARARSLALHASDCDRWGLSTDAARARHLATALRVDALAEIGRAGLLR